MINRRSLKLSGAVLTASLLALVVPVELSVSKLPAVSDVASAQEMPAIHRIEVLFGGGDSGGGELFHGSGGKECVPGGGCRGGGSDLGE